MSKSEYKKNFYPYTFLLIYFLMGATWFYLYLHAAFSANISLSSMDDVLLGIYLILPTLLAAIAFLTLISSQAIIAVLWNCSLFWVFLSVGKLIENGVLIPAPFQIYVAVILSFSCIGYLLFSHIRIWFTDIQKPCEHNVVHASKNSGPASYGDNSQRQLSPYLVSSVLLLENPNQFRSHALFVKPKIKNRSDDGHIDQIEPTPINQ